MGSKEDADRLSHALLNLGGQLECSIWCVLRAVTKRECVDCCVERGGGWAASHVNGVRCVLGCTCGSMARMYNPHQLKCAHMFCKLCIDRSLECAPKCPLCQEPANRRHVIPVRMVSQRAWSPVWQTTASLVVPNTAADTAGWAHH